MWPLKAKPLDYSAGKTCGTAKLTVPDADTAFSFSGTLVVSLSYLWTRTFMLKKFTQDFDRFASRGLFFLSSSSSNIQNSWGRGRWPFQNSSMQNHRPGYLVADVHCWEVESIAQLWKWLTTSIILNKILFSLASIKNKI